MNERHASEAVDALFEDLRDRRFLKWLFSAQPAYIGLLEGEELTSLDPDVQQDIRAAWSAIIAATLAKKEAETREADEAAILKAVYHNERDKEVAFDAVRSLAEGDKR